MSEKLELYVYTTHSYAKKNYLKVGHCKRGRHRERIAEQFGTSNPEQPLIRFIEDLPEGKTDFHLEGLPLVPHELTAPKALANNMCYGTGNEMMTPPMTS